MNQAILFNDDLTLVEVGIWQLSGFYQGQLLQFRIHSAKTEVSTSTKFDWEADIEDWLEHNEPEQPLVEFHFS